MAETKNLLTISTLETIRQTITIDEVAYELLEPSDFGLDQQIELKKTADRIQKAFDNPNEHTKKAARGELTGFVKTIVPKLPDEVMKPLKDAHKFSILTVFIKALEVEPAQD